MVSLLDGVALRRHRQHGRRRWSRSHRYPLLSLSCCSSPRRADGRPRTHRTHGTRSSGAAFAQRMAHGFGCKILYSGSRPKPEEAEPLGTGPYFFFFFGPCPRLDNKRWLTRGANGYDPGATYVPMDELLQRSDIVSVHCPLTPETRYTHNIRHNTHGTPHTHTRSYSAVTTSQGGCSGRRPLPGCAARPCLSTPAAGRSSTRKPSTTPSPPTPSPPRDSVSPPLSRSFPLFRFLLRSSHKCDCGRRDRAGAAADFFATADTAQPGGGAPHCQVRVPDCPVRPLAFGAP